MNFYKKIIRSRNVRKWILHLFDFIPDKTMLQIQYRLKTGHKLNLKNPQRYTEKLQWYKLYYHDPVFTTCSDKYLVRRYVEDKGLGFLLNENYGRYFNVDDIDFSNLPMQFALKCTAGSGDNIIVKDKTKLDFEKTKKVLREWLVKEKSLGREWCYYGVKPAILIEKYLGRDSRGDLPDYKFFCFDGHVYCAYVMVNYTDNHANGRLGFYDRDFNKMPYCRVDYKDIDFELEKPVGYEKMVEYAEILSKGFPHVRVDFFDINGEIIFGELTFYNASGYTKFSPDEFDFIMGKKFILPERKE